MLSIQLEGGLGNKLFQLAFLHSLKRQFQDIKVYCNKLCYGRTSHETVDWSIFTESFESISEEDLKKCVTIREEFHKPTTYVDYTEFIKKFNKMLNINFFGYFQSEKYFENVKNEVQALFGPTESVKTQIYNKYHNIENSYFLHVRRGDNIQNNRIALNEKYFTLAIKEIKKKEGNVPISFFICSDDIEWCKRKDFIDIFNDGDKLTFVEENEILTLWIMSLCKKGGIATNSTFSWWGGYLNTNPNKLIIFPNVISFEFNLNVPAWELGDLIPTSFTKIDVGDLEQYRVISH